jgi:glyceraldehyde 3-phosphate dehydrogenase
MVRIGINGFGRIGRDAARIILGRSDVALEAINSASDSSSHAYLLKHDSVYGLFPEDVSSDNASIIVKGKKILCFQEKDPENIPWHKADVAVVLECTGKYRNTADSSRHIRNSVQKVIISSPAKDDTPTYIMGVNHTLYKGEPVISNSSCTTNCVACVLAILDKTFGVVRGTMTTIHAITDSQNLLDNSHSKAVRLRRNSLVNLIPASSGSAQDMTKLFPHLADKLPCRAIRVPIPTVSLVEMTVEIKRSTTKDTVNTIFRDASANELTGILSVASEELVSSDFIGSPYSAVLDPYLTDVVNGTLVHITAWYDNEWGYTNRLVEMACYIGSK